MLLLDKGGGTPPLSLGPLPAGKSHAWVSAFTGLEPGQVDSPYWSGALEHWNL